MTTKMVSVGDWVAWDDVPIGALVLDDGDAYANRQADGGRVVGIRGHGNTWESRADMLHGDPEGPWVWGEQGRLSAHVVIIALDLTGNETADELRALAEAFERDHPAA